MSKKPNLKELKPLIEDWVTDMYLDFSNILAKEALNEVNKKLKKKHRQVSISTISPILTRLRKDDKEGKLKSDLDNPWNIGSCMAYGIPPDLVHVLLTIQISIKIPILTIRDARWCSFLFTAVNRLTDKQLHTAFDVLLFRTSPIPNMRNHIETLEKKKPKIDEPYLKLYWLLFLARLYARREKINSITNKNSKTLDTSELDQIFTNLDLSFMNMLDLIDNSIITPKVKKHKDEILSNLNNLSDEEIKLKFPFLNPEQIPLFKELSHAMSKGLVSLNEFIEQHQTESDMLCKIMEAVL